MDEEVSSTTNIVSQNVEQNDQVSNDTSINNTFSNIGNAVGPGRANERKIFLGGLNRETSKQDLQDYFTQFGKIENINIQIEYSNERTRGFAFIIFETGESVRKVIAVGNHVVKNKKIHVEISRTDYRTVFVAGITDEINMGDINSHFSQFGNIVVIERPFDLKKNRYKDFCFVTFETKKIYEKALQNRKQTIKNTQLDVTPAVPKSSKRDRRRSQQSSDRFKRHYSQPYGQYRFNRQKYYDEYQPRANKSYDAGGGRGFNRRSSYEGSGSRRRQNSYRRNPY